MMDIPPEPISRDKEYLKRHVSARKAFLSGKEDLSAEVSDLRKNSGDPASLTLLGVILCKGSEDDRKEAFSLFGRADAMGLSSGTRNLAYCYAVGIGTKKNKSVAAETYAKAADLGNAGAMCNLGVMYSFGNGVEKDDEKAFQCFFASAEGGWQRGMTNLGECYLWGRGTPKSVEQAEKWFQNSKSPRALYHLAEIYLDCLEWKDAYFGEAYLRGASDAGYSKAMYRYGRMIEENDPEEAKRLYEAAAGKGNAEAAARLEELGLKVPRSRRRKNNSVRAPQPVTGEEEERRRPKKHECQT